MRPYRIPPYLLTVLDAGVGLLNHLSSHPGSREVLLVRQTAHTTLLPIINYSHNLAYPPEQFLCTMAGAAEVVIKLIWDEDDPPFVPDLAVLHTIVWTLMCSLDGAMWAGITWSSLSRVQALSKLSALQQLKVHLIDMQLVETLARLLDQWTSEQGALVLEYALLTLLNLLTVEEARYRLYLTGIYRPLRSIVLGDEGATPSAREKAVLCAWLLFEWQVEKLELLDAKVKELMIVHEAGQRELLALHRGKASWHNDLLAVLEKMRAQRQALQDKTEMQQSEIDALQRALAREQQNHADDNRKNAEIIARLEQRLLEQDAEMERLRRDAREAREELLYWKRQAEQSVIDAREAAEREAKWERLYREAEAERQKALLLAEIRYQEMLVEGEARRRTEKLLAAHKGEEAALAAARQQLETVLRGDRKSVV